MKIDKLENRLNIKETENLNLKKVMAGEGLIPKKFVKQVKYVKNKNRTIS